MKAMILAAGLGKRLGKLTENIPKALVEINGKTALQLAVEKCTANGFNDIIINVHHLANMVINEVDRLNSLGFKISVSDERDKLLETGGGLYKARQFFDKSPFLIYNVDIISDLDLRALYNFHKYKSGLATLAVRNRQGNRFFLVDKSGIIKGWCNRATGERIVVSGSRENLSEIAFSGMHIVNPGIFSYMSDGIYSMTSVYLRLAQGERIYTYKSDEGFWGDIGTTESLEYVRTWLSR